jgi:hypothetical protein
MGGGGIANGGVVTVSGCTLFGNAAANGGGIYNVGQLTVRDKSTVSGNNASLGADLFEDVSAGATLSIFDSTIVAIFFM